MAAVLEGKVEHGRGGFGVDIIISGSLFGAIPAMWLIPALHGKIEPLMGMCPRVPGEKIPGEAPGTGWFAVVAIMITPGSASFAYLEAWDIEAGVYEPEFLEEYGMSFFWVGIGAIVLTFLIPIAAWKLGNRGKKLPEVNAEEAVRIAQASVDSADEEISESFSRENRR